MLNSRSFPFIGPSLWNRLPPASRNTILASESRLFLSVASTSHCHSSAYSICNLHPCARLRCKQAVARSTLASLLVDWVSLDRVLHSAARLIGGIPKFGHVSQYMLDVLHWFPAEQRISNRIASLVWRCLVGLAPVYTL